MIVALVSCSAEKAATPRPACLLYTSDLFRKSWAYARMVSDRAFVLSALHGVVEPDTVLSPYDVTMNGHGVLGRRRWADKVVAQLDALGLLHAEFPLNADPRFVMLAGLHYARPLASMLEDRGAHVSLPLGNRSIGHRLSWLKAHGPSINSQQTSDTAPTNRPVGPAFVTNE